MAKKKIADSDSNSAPLSSDNPRTTEKQSAKKRNAVKHAPPASDEIPKSSNEQTENTKKHAAKSKKSSAPIDADESSNATKNVDSKDKSIKNTRATKTGIQPNSAENNAENSSSSKKRVEKTNKNLPIDTHADSPTSVASNTDSTSAAHNPSHDKTQLQTESPAASTTPHVVNTPTNTTDEREPFVIPPDWEAFNALRITRKKGKFITIKKAPTADELKTPTPSDTPSNEPPIRDAAPTTPTESQTSPAPFKPFIPKIAQVNYNAPSAQIPPSGLFNENSETEDNSVFHGNKSPAIERRYIDFNALSHKIQNDSASPLYPEHCYPLSKPAHRKKMPRLTKDELALRRFRHNGECTSAQADRVPDLQTASSSKTPNPPIAKERYESFLHWMTAPWARRAFNERMAIFLRKTLVYWYVDNPLPLDDAKRYATPWLRSHMANLSFYMAKLIENPPDEPSSLFEHPIENEAENENNALSLIIENIFNTFNEPIKPFFYPSTDPSDLWHAHVAFHHGRMTALACDWLRCLEYILDGVHGGDGDIPLTKAFYNQFLRVRAIDAASAKTQGIDLPDFVLQQQFALSDPDIIILWLLVALEADPTFRNLMDTKWPNQRITPMMCPWILLQLLTTTSAERSALLETLSPSGFLASLGLIRITPNAAPTMMLYYEITVCEQIRNQFCGITSLSILPALFAELLEPHFNEDTYMAPTHTKTLNIIQNFIERPNLCLTDNLERENLNFIPSLAFLVEGLPGSGRATLVKIIASKLSKSVIVVQSNQLTNLAPGECDDILKATFIDAMLMHAFICFKDCAAFLTDERLAATLARHLARFPVVCALCVDLAVKSLPVIEPYITFKAKMDADLRENAAAMWKQHIALPLSDTQKIDVLQLSQQMALQPFQIQKATKLAYYSTPLDGNARVEMTNQKLERAAAVQVTKNIGNLAFVSDPEITLDDVIVSEDIMTKIQQIIGSAINRRRVLYDWGLSRRIRRGTGVIALFDGEPGTGKTHSAEAIAKTLGLSLMRINIATMVDKYIGETEKNLTTIFEQARPDMQLLLFDEADSLFTKRTANVSKSNDRYSNMSINVLLQLVERYEGVSILTTNLKNAIDPAFERRITYKVYFPMPKKPERERLWRYMCPPDVVTSEPIDYEWLSELELSGGEIKNAVLTAAFRAATKGVLLDSEILYDAGVSEASAAGRVMRRYDENSEDMFS